MGASYGGASGRSQGLSRAATRIRNNYINAMNSGDKKAADRERRRFKKETGRSITEVTRR